MARRTNTWRMRAAAVIQRVFALHPEMVGDPAREKELRKLVSAAYPFGARELWPYKAWCGAVRDAFHQREVKIGKVLGGLERRCDACGARKGMKCRSMLGARDADPVYAHEMVLEDARLEGRSAEDIEKLLASWPMHETRMPPPPTLPLFEGM